MQKESGERKWYMESQTAQKYVTPMWNAREMHVIQRTSSVNTHALHMKCTNLCVLHTHFPHTEQLKYKLISQVFELIGQLPLSEEVSAMSSDWLLSTSV